MIFCLKMLISVFVSNDHTTHHNFNVYVNTYEFTKQAKNLCKDKYVYVFLVLSQDTHFTL